MQSRHHLAVAGQLSAVLCLSFALGLLPAAPAHAQLDATAAPMTSANTAAPSDPEHEAALLRVVQAINFYPYFRQVVTPLFTTPDQPNDPALEPFLMEVMPPSWVNEFLVKLFRPALNGLSNKDLDDAARFFRTPAGQKYVAMQMHLTGKVKDDGAPIKFSPADNAAFERFARSPAGRAFYNTGGMMSGTAAEAWGEQVGKQRMLDVLKAAQAKYTAMADDEFQAEADKLHAGSSSATPVSQLAILVEFNLRSQRRVQGVFASGDPALRRIATMQPKDMISKEGIAQARQDLQTIDDLYTTSNQGMQMAGQFTLECSDTMAVPAGIRKVWRDAFDKQFKKTGSAIENLTGAVQDFTTSLRAALDFTEAHASGISLDKDGKLLFASQDDLAVFRALSAQIERSRTKLRESAAAAKA